MSSKNSPSALLKDNLPVLAATLLGGALIGAAATFAFSRRAPRSISAAVASGSSTAKWAAKSAAVPSRAAAVARGAESIELKREQLSRNEQFFGVEGQAAIEGAFVVVVGLGGVGSHAAHMLARSGVKHMRLVDFDNVTQSSLNRHAVATRGDVGAPKVAAMSRFLAQVVPWCTVDAVAEKFDAQSAESHLDGQPDFVLDCIDDMSTKAALLLACQERGLRVLSSMGAGGRADPTTMRVTTLSRVMHDPLANKLRAALRRSTGMRDSEATSAADPAEHIPVVCCVGPPRTGLLPLSDEQRAAPQEFGTMEGMRLRIMPVLGTLPAIFGQTMASVSLCELAGQPLEAAEFPALTHKILRGQKSKLLSHDKDTYGSVNSTWTLSLDDIDFIMHTVWRQRSALSGAIMYDFGARLQLTRWHADRAPAVDNLVLVTAEEAKQLATEGHQWLDEATVHRVEKRLAFAKSALLG